LTVKSSQGGLSILFCFTVEKADQSYFFERTEILATLGHMAMPLRLQSSNKRASPQGPKMLIVVLLSLLSYCPAPGLAFNAELRRPWDQAAAPTPPALALATAYSWVSKFQVS
jgi:hypothetical protein